MLALAGFPGREWATVKELADRLQLEHHSVVELVNRAQRQDLVGRTPAEPLAHRHDLHQAGLDRPRQVDGGTRTGDDRRRWSMQREEDDMCTSCGCESGKSKTETETEKKDGK